MKKSVLFLLLAFGVFGMALAAEAWPMRRPSATITATKTTVAPGESTMLVWDTKDATSAQLNITQWEPRTNGEIVPLAGARIVTPAETTTYTITAFWRRWDLNLDGRADGPRRSYTAKITITVK